MVKLRASLWILMGSVLIAGIYHLVTLPSQEESISKAKRDRESIVNSYLALFESEVDADLERFEKLIENLWEKNPGWEIGEAAALIYGLESLEDQARTKLDQIEGLGNTTALRYALDYGDTTPPEDWEPYLDDWVGAKIAVLVYERMDRGQDATNALVRLRIFESNARHGYQVAVWDLFLRLFGMGLLLSMWLSARQWRKLGEKFFRLDSLRFPLSGLLRFFGLYLFGFIILDLAAGFILSPAPDWLAHSLFYLAQIAWAIFLISKILFPLPPGVTTRKVSITRRLGIEDLNLRFRNIFQIIGAFAILVFLRQVGLFVDTAIGWPDGGDTNTRAALMELFEVLAAAVFYLIITCIISPVFEEFIFRGLLFRGLLAHLTPTRAILASGLAFAILHPIAYWPALFFMGIGLSLVYYRTANLMICICTHALWNLLVVALTLSGGVY